MATLTAQRGTATASFGALCSPQNAFTPFTLPPRAGIKKHISRETGVAWEHVTRPLRLGHRLGEEQQLQPADEGRTAFHIGFREGSVLVWAVELPPKKKKAVTGPVSTFDMDQYDI